MIIIMMMMIAGPAEDLPPPDAAPNCSKVKQRLALCL